MREQWLRKLLTWLTGAALLSIVGLWQLMGPSTASAQTPEPTSTPLSVFDAGSATQVSQLRSDLLETQQDVRVTATELRAGTKATADLLFSMAILLAVSALLHLAAIVLRFLT